MNPNWVLAIACIVFSFALILVGISGPWKFPLVSRKRLVTSETRLAIAEDALRQSAADVEHLKETRGLAQAEILKLREEIKGLESEHDNTTKSLQLQFDQCAGAQQAEIDRLTAAYEKLTADYNELGKKIPAFRPKAVRWSGPGGAKALIEAALYAQSAEGRAQRAISGNEVE